MDSKLAKNNTSKRDEPGDIRDERENKSNYVDKNLITRGLSAWDSDMSKRQWLIKKKRLKMLNHSIN